MKVALAYIFNHEGKVLLCRRPAGKMYGGLWEFPGGKLEPGESPEEAITRELEEELGVKTIVTQCHGDYLFEGDDIEIQFFPLTCTVESGSVQLLEHSEFGYFQVDRVSELDLAPPDYTAVEILLAS